MKYLLGCGYFQKGGAQAGVSGQDSRTFMEIWHANNVRYCNPAPEKTVCVAVGGCVPPELPGVQVVKLDGNLGHADDLLYGRKPHFLPGGPSIILALAAIAYCGEYDLIYKEQDCLAFGSWVERIYADAGDKGCIFGWCRMMGATCPLMLIKHHFIPHFLHGYLGLGDERDFSRLIEFKLAKLKENHPENFGLLSFGYDRDRPFNPSDPVWYVQHLSVDELTQIKSLGLI